MTIDPTMLASLAGNFVTVGALSWALISRGKWMDTAKGRAQEIVCNLTALNAVRIERDDLAKRLAPLEARYAKQRADAKAASAKGHAVQSAKAKERREAAASKTLCEAKDALGRMRSRAQVVAPVKAARARKIKQESGAGSAA